MSLSRVRPPALVLLTRASGPRPSLAARVHARLPALRAALGAFEPGAHQ